MAQLLQLINRLLRPRCGQLLIEVLITLGISAIILPALLTALFTSHQGKAQTTQRTQAVALLKESEEIVRSVREKGWNSFAQNGIFHPNISQNAWALTSGEETINGYTRSITISDVFRDGILDPSTKKIDLSVSWGTPYASNVNSSIYLTRYLNNTINIQTSVSDFNSGTSSATVVTSDNGGGVILGASGGGDWCDPSLSITALDLPKTGKATSVTAVFGEAFAGTGENSTGESLADINITDTDPPVASLIETVDGYKTNDIFGEANYAYLATDVNSQEIVIYNISSIPFTQAGFFNAPPNENGDSVFVANNIGYVVIKETLYNFDLSSKNGSRPALDSNGVALSKEGTSVYVVDNYAYVSIKGDNNVQMDIIDISNSSNMQKVGSADVNNQSGQDVFVNSSGTRAYVVTNATSPDEKEFHIINITNKANPVKVGTGYYTNGMNPEGIEIVSGNRAIIVGQGGEEYQVLNLSNELSLVSCGGLDVNSGIFDSASILEPDGDAYAYIVTGDASSEFKMIKGGLGGQYVSSGTFESSIIDRGSAVSFNRLIANTLQPPQTTLRFQVAGAAPVNASCANATYTYVGPDGTANTFFPNTGGAIPLVGAGTFQNPAQCIRYKAYLSTTDPNVTPEILDVSINYSP